MIDRRRWPKLTRRSGDVQTPSSSGPRCRRVAVMADTRPSATGSAAFASPQIPHTIDLLVTLYGGVDRQRGDASPGVPGPRGRAPGGDRRLDLAGDLLRVGPHELGGRL